MNSGRIEDIVKNSNFLADVLKGREAKKKGANPLVVCLAIIGGLTVGFALIYAFYNLVSGNAYKDVDEEEVYEEETSEE